MNDDDLPRDCAVVLRNLSSTSRTQLKAHSGSACLPLNLRRQTNEPFALHTDKWMDVERIQLKQSLDHNNTHLFSSLGATCRSYRKKISVSRSLAHARLSLSQTPVSFDCLTCWFGVSFDWKNWMLQTQQSWICECPEVTAQRADIVEPIQNVRGPKRINKYLIITLISGRRIYQAYCT